MKKLLLLGGSRYLLPVIKTAHELGIYVITCDYLPDNIAHQLSDEYHNISIIDKDSVLKLAQNNNIDGIMSFACDPGVVTAAYVAEKMNLPFCGSYNSVLTLQNKDKFRAFLSENGFNVPMAKGYNNPATALKEASDFKFPVIVKPVDSAGSKGVSKVDNPSQLQEKISFALQHSLSKKFIIEEFINKKGDSSDSDCFSVDGEFRFITYSNQKFDMKAQNPYTPAAYTWPSNMSKENQEFLNKELQRLITLLDLKTSIYNVEVREDENGTPYIMEVSPRGGGNRLSEMIKLATGVDLIKNAVLAAVGEQTEQLNYPEYKTYIAECILHSNLSGVYKDIEISHELQVEQLDLWIDKGSKINDFTGANEAIGTLVLRFNDPNTMDKIMNDIDNYVKIIVE